MIGNRKYNIKQQDNAKPYIDCLNLPIQGYAPNTHIRVTGNTLIRLFIITLIWVLKAVSNKQERTTLNN